MPFIAQVAVGRREKLLVFGDDYPTPDGTPLRDYIHVEDLAAGHLAALAKLGQVDDPVSTWNLGTGHGTSVLEVLHAFEQAVGHELPYEVVGRRAGDLPESFADPSRAHAELGWRAERTHRGHVRRPVAVAERQPHRLPRRLTPAAAHPLDRSTARPTTRPVSSPPSHRSHDRVTERSLEWDDGALTRVSAGGWGGVGWVRGGGRGRRSRGRTCTRATEAMTSTTTRTPPTTDGTHVAVSVASVPANI